MVSNGIEHQFLCLELRIDVFIGINVLSDVEVLLRQFDLRSGDIIDTDACNAVRRDMDEARTRAQTESNQMAHRLDIDHFNVVACREVLHVGNAIDDS